MLNVIINVTRHKTSEGLSSEEGTCAALCVSNNTLVFKEWGEFALLQEEENNGKLYTGVKRH